MFITIYTYINRQSRDLLRMLLWLPGQQPICLLESSCPCEKKISLSLCGLMGGAGFTV